MDKALLIIMAKWHGFGRCKTRLSKDIGKSNSAKVQSVMTKHTISVAKFLQENKLKKKTYLNRKIMSHIQIKRFVMFYQRITLQMIKDLSKSASIVMLLNKNHEIKKALFKS